MNFNEILIMERKKRGLNQEQLAELLNVSRQSISKWENGEAFPEYAKLIALADVLGCSLDYLCGREAAAENDGENPAPVHRKKLLWLVVVLIIEAMLIGVVLFGVLGDDAEPMALTENFTAELVGLCANADRVLKCEFAPDFIDESFEYLLVFKSVYDGEEEIFPVAPQTGTISYIAELKYHHYSSLSLVMKKDDVQAVAVLAKDIQLGENQVSWTPVE